jgi:pimeloyl-ACP methyl ester carboxylesterase
MGGPPDQAPPAEPPQNLKEYDPEWARAFWTGQVGVGCDHLRMLSSVKVPVLLTQHYREIDPGTGALMGAVSDQQVKRAGELVTEAGQLFEVVDLPDMAHAMHAHAPRLFTQTIVDWSSSLG